VAHRAKEIEFPLDASTSGGTKTIAAAVISQTSVMLGDSDLMVRNRDKTTQKNEDDTFVKILAGKRPPENHPFVRLNKTAQYETALFKHG